MAKSADHFEEFKFCPFRKHRRFIRSNPFRSFMGVVLCNPPVTLFLGTRGVCLRIESRLILRILFENQSRRFRFNSFT